MTETKFQKLAYYCQALSLVRLGRPLFPDAIGAWPHGPVVRSLYGSSEGVFVDLPAEDKQAIREALAIYGQLTAAQLTRLSHGEAPWKNTRGTLPANAKTSRIIPIELIRQYHSANGFITKRSAPKL